MKENRQDEQIPEHHLITQLFDTQPDSVVWFIPTYTAADTNVPVDFEVGYCNTAACMILKAPKHRVMGASLKTTDLMDEVSRQKIWEHCLQVWTTGMYREFTYYSPGLD